MHIGGEKGDGWMPACRGCVGAALSHVRGRRARGGSSAATSTAWEHTPHAAFLLQGEMLHLQRDSCHVILSSYYSM